MSSQKLYFQRRKYERIFVELTWKVHGYPGWVNFMGGVVSSPPPPYVKLFWEWLVACLMSIYFMNASRLIYFTEIQAILIEINVWTQILWKIIKFELSYNLRRYIRLSNFFEILDNNSADMVSLYVHNKIFWAGEINFWGFLFLMKNCLQIMHISVYLW